MRQSVLHKKICDAVKAGILIEPFDVKAVNNKVNNILKNSPAFLSKHRIGNPGGYSERFKRVKPGFYQVINCDLFL